MSEVLDDKGSLSINNSAITAAYFHAKFESIHPFADGDGRTGRLLMNYLLLSLDCPLTVIAAGRYAAKYYGALKSYSAEGDLKPLTNLINDQTVRTWEPLMRGWEYERG